MVFCPGKLRRWASLFIPFVHFYITFTKLRLLFGFPLVFECMSCKTCFLHYKWNYVNSICMCQKYVFSPIYAFNWWSDLIVSDRQHTTNGHGGNLPLLVVVFWASISPVGSSSSSGWHPLVVGSNPHALPSRVHLPSSFLPASHRVPSHSVRPLSIPPKYKGRMPRTRNPHGDG